MPDNAGLFEMLDAPAEIAHAAVSNCAVDGARVRDDRVMAATAALPDHYRVVLALKYMQGRSVDEIAERLQMTPGSVRSRLSRAYGLLRKRLEAGPVPEMPPAAEEDNDAL